MKVSQNKKTRAKRQLWNEQELKKLLQFIILNPHKVYQSPSGNQTITSLQQVILTKSHQKCFIKMQNLFRNYKSVENVVSYLKKVTFLSDDWIKQKQTQNKYLKVSFFEKDMDELQQSYSIEEQVRINFISDFNFHEIQAKNDSTENKPIQIEPFGVAIDQHNDIGNSTENKPIQIEPFGVAIDQHNDIGNDQFDNLMQQNSSIFKGPQVKLTQQEHLSKLRYILFLKKYKREFEADSKRILINSIFHRMISFIEFKQHTWKTLHSRGMNRHHSIEAIIEKNKHNLYVSPQQFYRELARVQAFYQEDIHNEMCAFRAKSKTRLLNSDQEIDAIVKEIRQIVSKQVESEPENYPSENNVAPKEFNSKLLNKIIVKVPVVWQIVSNKHQEDKEELIKTTKKSSFPQSKRETSDVSNHSSHSLIKTSKKQQLKQKKLQKGFIKVKDINNSLLQAKQKDHQIQEAYKSSNDKDHRIQEAYKSSNDKDHQIQEAYKCSNDKDHRIQEAYKSSNDDRQSLESSNHVFDSDNSDNGIKESDYSQEGEKTVKKRKVFIQQIKAQHESGKQHEDQFVQKKNNTQKMAEQQEDAEPQRIWALSQRIKIAYFLALNKKRMITANCNQKSKLKYDILKYLGTNKSYSQLTHYLNNASAKFNYDIQSFINKEAQKFNLTQDFLTIYKQITDSYQQNSKIRLVSGEFLMKTNPWMLKIIPIQKKFDAILKQTIRKGPLIQLKPFLKSLSQAPPQIDCNNNKCIIQKNLIFQINLRQKIGKFMGKEEIIDQFSSPLNFIFIQ